MTVGATRPTRPVVDAPSSNGASGDVSDASVARLHLRVGMLGIAHAELEELEARGALDGAGRLALAEVRWRTGDLEGAAEAASAYVKAGGEAPLALVIGAEWASAIGRPGEARIAIDRLGAVDAVALDALFAGMPRRAFWPSAPNAAVHTETLFDVERPRGAPRAPETTAGDGAVAGDGVATEGRLGAAPGTRDQNVDGRAPRPASVGPGFWDEGAAGSPAGEDGPPRHHVDPSAQLDLAKEELTVDPAGSALRLALVLRQDPTLAPAVLEAIAGRRGPAFDVVRGDAQRLLGRHLEAEASYTSAAVAVDAAVRERGHGG